MSSQVDKALDSIIDSKSGSKKRPRGRTVAKKTALGGKARAKTPGKAAKAAKADKIAAAAAAAATSTQDPTYYALRAIVSGMPRDVSEAQVREFFSKEVGPLGKVEGSYNAKGTPTGSFTLTFRKQGHAAQAMNRFNDTAVDGGARTMKVQVIMDPSAKPLAARLSLPATKSAGKDSASTTAVSKSAKRRAKAKAKAAVAATGGAAAAKPAQQNGGAKKSARRGKKGRPVKSAAELDAEMNDYFAQSEATVDAGIA